MFEYEYESRFAEYEYGRSSTLRKNVLVLENQNRYHLARRRLPPPTPHHQLPSAGGEFEYGPRS